jgi:hypothetical protein
MGKDKDKKKKKKEEVDSDSTSDSGPEDVRIFNEHLHMARPCAAVFFYVNDQPFAMPVLEN